MPGQRDELREGATPGPRATLGMSAGRPEPDRSPEHGPAASNALGIVSLEVRHLNDLRNAFDEDATPGGGGESGARKVTPRRGNPSRGATPPRNENRHLPPPPAPPPAPPTATDQTAPVAEQVPTRPVTEPTTTDRTPTMPVTEPVPIAAEQPEQETQTTETTEAPPTETPIERFANARRRYTDQFLNDAGTHGNPVLNRVRATHMASAVYATTLRNQPAPDIKVPGAGGFNRITGDMLSITNVLVEGNRAAIDIGAATGSVTDLVSGFQNRHNADKHESQNADWYQNNVINNANTGVATGVRITRTVLQALGSAHSIFNAMKASYTKHGSKSKAFFHNLPELIYALANLTQGITETVSYYKKDNKTTKAAQIAEAVLSAAKALHSGITVAKKIHSRLQVNKWLKERDEMERSEAPPGVDLEETRAFHASINDPLLARKEQEKEFLQKLKHENASKFSIGIDIVKTIAFIVSTATGINDAIKANNDEGGGKSLGSLFLSAGKDVLKAGVKVIGAAEKTGKSIKRFKKEYSTKTPPPEGPGRIMDKMDELANDQAFAIGYSGFPQYTRNEERDRNNRAEYFGISEALSETAGDLPEEARSDLSLEKEMAQISVDASEQGFIRDEKNIMSKYNQVEGFMRLMGASMANITHQKAQNRAGQELILRSFIAF